VNLRIVISRGIPEDSDLHRQWNAIALQMEPTEVFYTYEWALAIQTAYGASVRPLLVMAYEGTDLVGIASLAVDCAGKSASFLASNTADYCDFLSAPQHRVEFVRAALSELRKINIDSIAFANVPEGSPTSAALRDKSGLEAWHVFIRPAYACARVELGTAEARETLKNSLLAKKKLRRYLREMEREGPITFEHAKPSEEIHKYLPAFAEAHVARFLATGKVSSLSSFERRRFLEELAKRFDGSGVVTLSMLKVRDRPIAWNFGFQFQGSWFWYQPTFESCQEQNSPGHCLLSRIVIDACGMDGMRVIDLGLGAEGYKERFANTVRHTLHASLTKSKAQHLSTLVRFQTVGALKRSPKIESIVRSVLRRPSA
jgi:CelD/BcsL family acetyltransferase involved in cellulose biosynthesis